MLTPQPIDGQAPEHLLQRRSSTAVANCRPTELQARERVERLVCVHGPEIAAAIAHQFDPHDRLALRVVAAGVGSAAGVPTLRKSAITALGHLRSVEDLNTLCGLARSDPNPEVRAAALLSLARTALSMAAPVLRDALASRDLVVREAAEQGIVLLARDIGVRGVRDAMRLPVGVGRLVRSAEALLAREGRKASEDSGYRRARRDPM